MLSACRDGLRVRRRAFVSFSHVRLPKTRHFFRVASGFRGGGWFVSRSHVVTTCARDVVQAVTFSGRPYSTNV